MSQKEPETLKKQGTRMPDISLHYKFLNDGNYFLNSLCMVLSITVWSGNVAFAELKWL
jgi:hypothetical protein